MFRLCSREYRVMQEWQGWDRKPVTEERLMRAVAVLAEIVEEHGPAYGPLYESVQLELAEFRRRHQQVEEPAGPSIEDCSRKVA